MIARTQDTYLGFLLYLDETGLDEEVRAICRAHAVVLREVYMDFRGPSVMAARLEAWQWLTGTIGKSPSEVARIFDREPSSVYYALKRLREQAVLDGVDLARDARTVARTVATGLRRPSAGRKP